MLKNLDLTGKTILLAVLAAVAVCIFCSSCASSKYGCPATSGFSGYHGR